MNSKFPIFRGYFSQEDKAKFGLVVQHQQGREWFSKFIDNQVSELIRVHIIILIILRKNC